jgi:adenylate cyclase class 2
MDTEIEAKLKVDSLEEVKQKLVELGAEFLAEQLQTDCYFDDAGSTMKTGDKALRLRRQLTGKIEKVFLTYKGPKVKDNFKKRREIEIEIKNADSAEELLLSLGYEKILVFEKKRQVWKLSGCVVALDELPLLGSFVEIEGPDDKKISNVQKSLGLAYLSHIVESYADLVAKKCLK